MKKNLLWILLFSIILNINQGYSQNIWEYRSHYEIAYSISENILLKMKPKLWFNEIVNDLYSSDVEIGVDKKLNNWLRINPYYRHIISIDGNNRSREYRPQVDITVSKKLKDISFQSRNRFEYRIKTENKSVRYRNKLTIKSPIHFHDKIRLGVSEEPFYNSHSKEFDKNRVYLTINFPLENNITVEIFYIMEHLNRENKWEYVNVLGTTLKYKI